MRHGSDVFKALALGADLVLVGRPVLWGMSYDGQDGVELVANILEREFARTMALSGTPDIQTINSGYLGVRKRDGFGVARLYNYRCTTSYRARIYDRFPSFSMARALSVLCRHIW